MGTGELNAGGNAAMDLHPIQGGVEILLVASCYGKPEISAVLLGHLARMQTLSPLSVELTSVLCICRPDTRKSKVSSDNARDSWHLC